MRINPISYGYTAQKQAFKGVSNNPFNQNAVQEVMGNKVAIYDRVSDEKGLDIWLFKKTKGGMAKMDDGYVALIQDKDDGTIIKEIKCSNGDEALKTFKRRLEDSVVWAKATSNMYASATLLQDRQTMSSNPKFAKKLLNKMQDIGGANQMSGWSAHLKEI